MGCKTIINNLFLSQIMFPWFEICYKRCTYVCIQGINVVFVSKLSFWWLVVEDVSFRKCNVHFSMFVFDDWRSQFAWLYPSSLQWLPIIKFRQNYAHLNTSQTTVVCNASPPTVISLISFIWYQTLNVQVKSWIRSLRQLLTGEREKQ